MVVFPMGGGDKLRHLLNYFLIQRRNIMLDKRQNKNFEIELVKRMRIERYEETRIWSDRVRWTGTVCYLGPDRQHGRQVYLCFGPYRYFVSSREANGRLTYRTASLELAGICPSRITLETAIRLMDEIDADYFRKIAGSNRKRRDIVS